MTSTTSSNLTLGLIFLASMGAMAFGHLSGPGTTAALIGAVASVMSLTHLSLTNLSTIVQSTASPAVAEVTPKTVVVPPTQVNH